MGKYYRKQVATPRYFGRALVFMELCLIIEFTGNAKWDDEERSSIVQGAAVIHKELSYMKYQFIIDEIS